MLPRRQQPFKRLPSQNYHLWAQYHCKIARFQWYKMVTKTWSITKTARFQNHHSKVKIYRTCLQWMLLDRSLLTSMCLLLKNLKLRNQQYLDLQFLKIVCGSFTHVLTRSSRKNILESTKCFWLTIENKILKAELRIISYWIKKKEINEWLSNNLKLMKWAWKYKKLLRTNFNFIFVTFDACTKLLRTRISKNYKKTRLWKLRSTAGKRRIKWCNNWSI